MTREEAIKCIQEEKLRYERAPWVNSCPMTEEWQKAIDICDMAISALLAQQEQESKPLNGWISLKDRLPEKDENYIVMSVTKDVLPEKEFGTARLWWLQNTTKGAGLGTMAAMNIAWTALSPTGCRCRSCRKRDNANAIIVKNSCL